MISNITRSSKINLHAQFLIYSCSIKYQFQGPLPISWPGPEVRVVFPHPDHLEGTGIISWPLVTSSLNTNLTFNCLYFLEQKRLQKYKTNYIYNKTLNVHLTILSKPRKFLHKGFLRCW